MKSDDLLARLAATYGYDPHVAGVSIRPMCSRGPWARYFIALGLGRASTFGPAHYRFASKRDHRGVWVVDPAMIPTDDVTVCPGLGRASSDIQDTLRILVEASPDPDPNCLADLKRLAAIGRRFGRPRSPNEYVGLVLTSQSNLGDSTYALDDGVSGDLYFGPAPRTAFPLHVVPALRDVRDDPRGALVVIHDFLENTDA